jgi:adenylylsulfate kinase
VEGVTINLTWHHSKISKEDRQKLNKHQSCVLWFTGLSGSGKSTIAMAVEELLFRKGVHCYTLDGDNIRHGLNKDLTFTMEDRKENIRRIGEVSKLFMDAGLVVLTAFISPYQSDRAMVRTLFQPGEFIEIYVKCSLEECERRDPKGLYRKARTGEIQNFTGISGPYEAPTNPEILIETDKQPLCQSVSQIIGYLQSEKYI